MTDMKNTLLAGFARADITPPMDIAIAGYFEQRNAKGVLDNLEVQAVALSDGKNKAVILSADLIGIQADDVLELRKKISQATAIPIEAVFIACTHTHTGPHVSKSFVGDLDEKWHFYKDLIKTRFADAALFACQDMKPARMGYGTAIAPNIAFIRRFRMKDGSVRTNPGVNNPDIVAPIGQVDETVKVLRFERAEGDIVIVNFGVHPDTVGGEYISADYPRFVRQTLEKSIDGCHCMFLNGVQGDVNHVNTSAKDGDKNGLAPTFDGCDRGYEHAKHMGRTIAGAVLQIYGKVNFTEVDKISFGEQVCSVPSNMPKPSQLDLARKYAELHKQGKDSEIPFLAMELTTVVAESLRMLELEHGPEKFDLPLLALAIGPAALIGIPGEPFTGIGVGLRQGSPYDITLACCAANGYEGYFPMQEAYDEGGYEARSSRFKAGVAERIIESGTQLLCRLDKSDR